MNPLNYRDWQTLPRISPRAVHRHTEHIYSKLGVETRTSAMLGALKVLH